MADIIERPVPPDEAPKHVGRDGFYCEHETTDRMGFPVRIAPNGMTVWKPTHIQSTDGSLETTPTTELTFWQQDTEQ